MKASFEGFCFRFNTGHRIFQRFFKVIGQDVLILNLVTKIQSLLFTIAFYIDYHYICTALTPREEGTLKVPSFYLYTRLKGNEKKNRGVNRGEIQRRRV